MRLIKFTELKGILALSGIALIFATVYLGFRGTISEWIGRPITLKDPITNKIVFVSDRGGQPDLWIMDPDGSNQKALTNDALVETSPAVSPDGLTIAYIGRDGSGNTEVYAVDADGTHRRRITKITGAKSDLKFSPDGRRIIFLASGEVWQVDKQGNHPKRL
ncbi:MAG TPA: DPP IV N-terminal domain-containing protein, partial [Armatimonadota bacterium]|nr:DPP IV N-terminal domain-containing protein [Armatimonadota bacterium]